MRSNSASDILSTKHHHQNHWNFLVTIIMSDKVDVPGVPAFNLTARDKEILSQTDEEYHLQTWDDLKTIIGSSALNTLLKQRTKEPSPDHHSQQCPGRTHASAIRSPSISCLVCRHESKIRQHDTFSAERALAMDSSAFF